MRQLRAAGRDRPDELLARISPAHSENVNFFDVITVNVEAELGKLDGGGSRPLRPAQLRELGLTHDVFLRHATLSACA